MMWHPSPESLQDYAAGAGSDDDFAQVEKHLQECATCLERVEYMGHASIRAEIVAAAIQARLLPMRECVADDHVGSTSQSGITHTRADSSLGNEGYPRNIGAYTLQRLLGEGGMGAVFLAKQLAPVQRLVALKLLKPSISQRSSIRRFEFERQTLASLDHPNIARLLDAGTSQGFHFFVMELIDGLSLTKYCDAHQLNLKQRLTLFIRLCRAVQYAHQKAVIHRDLKPSNILVSRVDQEHQLKVIDFGIAKSAESAPQQTAMTQIGQVLGTWQYMSPEQLSLDPSAVDTRSDVYALGAILYELLVGQPPLQLDSTHQIDTVYRAIREQEPLRPSKVIRELPNLESLASQRSTTPQRYVRQLVGELDWIVAKTLEKNPSRRYQSAESLAFDIQQHLDGLPLSIPSPSTFVTLSKTWRRHRGPISGALLLICALTVGLCTTLWFYHKSVIAYQQIAELAYISMTGDAQASLAEGNIERAKRLLSKQIPNAGDHDYRGWEWYHLWSRCQSTDLIGSVQFGHDEIHDVEYSPDGKKLGVAILNSQCAAVLDAETHEVLAKLNCNHRGMALTFTRDSSQLIVVCANGEIYFWNFVTGRESHKQPTTRILRGVALSPDESTLAVCGDAGIFWYDMHDLDKPPHHTTSEKRVLELDFSPDGRFLITGDWTDTERQLMAELRLFDAANHQLLASYPVVSSKRNSTQIRSVSFFRDGSRIIAGLSNGQIAIWDLIEPSSQNETIGFSKPILLKGTNSGEVYSVKYSRVAELLAFGGSGNHVPLYDARLIDTSPSSMERLEIKRYREHSSTVRTVAFSPVSGVLATADANGLLNFWKPSRVRNYLDTGIDKPTCIALDATDQFALVGSETGTTLWNLANASCELNFPEPSGYIVDVAIWPAATTTFQCVIIDTKGKLTIREFRPNGSHATENSPASAAAPARTIAGSHASCVVESTQNHLIIGGTDGSVSRLLPNGSLQKLCQPDQRPIVDIQYSVERKLFVTTSLDRSIKIFDSNWQELAHVRPGFSCQGTAICPTGAWIAIRGESSLIGLYDLEKRELRQLAGHAGSLRSLAFSHDGLRLASGGEDRLLKLWDTSSWQEVFSSAESKGYVTTIAFSSDDSQLITGDTNYRLRFLSTFRR